MQERLTALGFPVYQELARRAGCEIFNVNSKQAKQMAGNAWHVANAGTVLLVALASIILTDTDN